MLFKKSTNIIIGLLLTLTSVTVLAGTINKNLNCARIALLGAKNPEVYKVNAFSNVENKRVSLAVQYGPRMAMFDKENPSSGLTVVPENYSTLLYAGTLYGEPQVLMNATLQLSLNQTQERRGYITYSVLEALDVQDPAVSIATAKKGVDAYYKAAQLGAEEPTFRKNDLLKDRQTIRVVATIENQVVGYWQMIVDTGAGENLNLIVPYAAYLNDPTKLVAEVGRRFVADHYINAQGQRIEIDDNFKRQIGLDLRYRLLSIAHNMFLVKQLWYASSKKTITQKDGSQTELWKAIMPKEYVLSELPILRPESDIYLNILGRLGDLIATPNHSVLGMFGDEFLMTILAHSLMHWELLLMNGLKALEVSHQSHLVIGVESYEWLFLVSFGFLKFEQNADKTWVAYSNILGRKPRVLRDNIPNAEMNQMYSQTPLISPRNLTVIIDKEDILTILSEIKKIFNDDKITAALK